MLDGPRLSSEAARLRIDAAAAAGIEIAGRGLPALHEAMDLAQAHQLSVHDALYLQLALDVDGELATEDRAPADAALAEGVLVVG